MNFKTNLNTFSLLGNEKIKFYFDDKIVEFVPPNLRLYINDIEFNYVKTLLFYKVKDFKKLLPNSNVIVENEYDVLLAMLKLEINKDLILKYFKLLFPNLIYQNSNFFVEEEMLVYDEYRILLDAILVACAEKDLKAFFKENEPEVKEEEENLDPAIKKMREAQEKVKKIKSKKTKNSDKKNDKTKDGEGITIDQIVVALVYEFNFSIAEIYDMNMFALLHFWTYISKVIDTQIQIVAAGNGLTKEFTYFINWGEK